MNKKRAVQRVILIFFWFFVALISTLLVIHKSSDFVIFIVIGCMLLGFELGCLMESELK